MLDHDFIPARNMIVTRYERAFDAQPHSMYL